MGSSKRSGQGAAPVTTETLRDRANLVTSVKQQKTAQKLPNSIFGACPKARGNKTELKKQSFKQGMKK